MSAIPYVNRDGASSPRAFLQTAMSLASLHLDHAADHLATNDDIALKRSLEKFGACVKAMLDTVPEVLADDERRR
jgi:hypothetical protein